MNLDQPLHPEIHELSEMLQIDYFKDKFNEIVEVINDYKKEKKRVSLTIGIEGDWGSGKTSFINYVTFFLENLSDGNYFVNFNIWDYKKDNIKEEFFKSLYFSLYKKPGFSSIFKASSISFKLFGLGVRFSGSNFLENFDILKFKEKIKDFLITKNKYLFVIIDDLDRASKDEILQVFSLIKSGFDIQNVVFVLLYSKKHLINRVSSEFNDNNSKAEKYIEKIIMKEIQYSQYITEQDIIKLFSEELFEKIKNKTSNIYENDIVDFWFNDFFDEVKNIYNDDYFINTGLGKILIYFLFYLSFSLNNKKQFFSDKVGFVENNFDKESIKNLYTYIYTKLRGLNYREWKLYEDLVSKFVENENRLSLFITFITTSLFYIKNGCSNLKESLEVENVKLYNSNSIIMGYLKLDNSIVKKYFHC